MIQFSRRRTPANLGAGLVAVAMIGMGTLAAMAQEIDPGSVLPAGPKDLLATATEDAAVLAGIVGASRSQDEWVSYIDTLGFEMTVEQRDVLAEYLALNVHGDAPEAADVETMVAGLPADGRELFLTGCFSCHGVAAYYLLQDRDAAGWMTIFDAPYHRRLMTGDNERETFASYSAYAMPIPADEIPEAWQDP